MTGSPPPDAAPEGELLEALHRESFGWALTCCGGCPADAEEVLQMSYAKYFNGKLRHAGRSAFKTWWFGVVRVTAHEHRRRTWLRWLRFAPIEEAGERAAEDAEPDAAAARGEVVVAVQAALAQLSVRQREIVCLVFIHGLSLDEAAAVSGVSSGSAHTHYQRGKERLRGLLRSHLPAGTSL